MTSKKNRVLAILALLMLIFAGLSYSWTSTDHGHLDYRAAVSLKLLSFDMPYKPDPNGDFEISLPVNLIYAASGMLPAHEVARTEDIQIPSADGEIPARIYWPRQPLGETPPLIIYYHGGGFVVGSVDIFDPLTRELADRTGAIVVSVEYRLAPTHPYPAAVDDAYAALRWGHAQAAALGGDPNTLLVGGDSAGGNLAAVMAQRTRDQDGPTLAGQILYYPAVDVGSGERWASEDAFRDGYGLSTASMTGFRLAYLGETPDPTDPYISPLRAKSVAGLAPALLVTAGFDPLTDSARAYGERLRAAGVQVDAAHYPSMIHGFMSVGLFTQQNEAMARTVDFVQAIARTQ